MKMLDYVQLAHVRMGENLERSSELVAQLVDIFQSGSFDALRIVASGSSRHAADCARDYLQDALQMQVSVVTPEAFVDFEHTYPQHVLNIGRFAEWLFDQYDCGARLHARTRYGCSCAHGKRRGTHQGTR